MKIHHKTLALFCILLFPAQLILFTPFLNGAPDFSLVEYGFEEHNLTVTYTMSSKLTSQNVGIFAMPLSHPLRDRDIFIYYDRQYPNSLVGRKEWLGIADHMFVQLKNRGYGGAVSIVNAQELQKVMQQEKDSIVLITSGVFPDTVHNASSYLVQDWLRAGGILVWAGDLLGLYYGHVNEEWYDLWAHSNEIENWQKNVERILSYNPMGETLFDENNMIATEDSVFSNALDLRYEDASRGPVLDELFKNNITVLGKMGTTRASIAFLPVGNGGVVLFGGAVLPGLHTQGVTYVARDIAQILTSGFLDSSGQVVTKVYSLEKGKTLTDKMIIPFSQEKDFVFVAFSRQEFNTFSYHRIVIQRP